MNDTMKISNAADILRNTNRSVWVVHSLDRYLNAFMADAKHVLKVSHLKTARCNSIPLKISSSLDARYLALSPSALYQSRHKSNTTDGEGATKILFADHQRYFVALNFHNSEQVLPTIIQGLLRLADFLGPDRLYISVFENGSTDNTKALLHMLEDILTHAGIMSTIILSDEISDYRKLNRIELLAGYLYYCLDDILELLYQAHMQQADITCGFDYWERTDKFYDTWVARTMSGNMFREYFYQGTFVYDPEARSRYELGLPVQIYSCWNGMVVLNSEPFYKHHVRFRRGNQTSGECAASECQLIAKDFWELGYGKALVVPHVRLVYDLWLHESVRKKKFDLIEMGLHLRESRFLKDIDGTANRKRKTQSKNLGLNEFGGRPLDTRWWDRMTWLGWIHEPEWVAGKFSEVVNWVYPGPTTVVCFSMDGINNHNANWNNPMIEHVPYHSP
ncbi:hypothetical protein BASA50_006524 [Batrachochytrium salamandrivorans]|uniref:Alpha-1,3-mannosyltransferase CMT1 n=1 Tax=Batrachochytrium salamandrivorans TaxID=1357716 RepID=A0ABQ8F9N7_9FUNG|nr:hypothetical protein BASA50_006524 [Batrachochytrium salamandrivorans]